MNDVARFTAQVNNEQRAAGYRLLGIFEEGKNNAVAVCGFRITTTLAFGRHIVIDDLVTVPQTRGRGYCTHLLQAVVDIAESENIAQIHTHVSVGSERAASLGVVGPTRMDYPSTIASVRAVARYVSRILTEG